MVDDVGTIAIASGDRFKRFGVTTDMNLSYLAPAKSGDTVLIEASVLMSGLTMAFVEVALRRERDGKLLACGRMSKFLADAKTGGGA